MDESLDRSKPMLHVRLSVMMFLQYAIWGAWLPLLWSFLSGHRGFAAGQIGDMFAVGAVGSIIAPFVAGQIADRWFSTEKYLGISHILGGVLVWQLSHLTGYWEFLAFSLAYSLIYSPTLSLTNSLSFHHIRDRDKEFGKIRLWGTIGWIAVGIGIGQWLLASWTPDKVEPAPGITVAEIVADPARGVERALAANPRQLGDVLTPALVERASGAAVADMLMEMKVDVPMRELPDGTRVVDEGAALAAVTLPVDELAARREAKLGEMIVAGAQQKGMQDAFRLSAILGMVMGVYCFTLPHTPPSRGREKLAFVEAMKEIRLRPLSVLFLIAVPVSCIHQFYFVHTAGFLGTFQSKAATAINGVFGVGGGGLMTIGQMSEIVVLALIPLVAKTLSRKSLLTIGLCAYAARMALFAFVVPISAALGVPEVAVLMLGIALHGVCFGCFVFIAFMVVDEETTSDVRASAQSLFSLILFGVGIIVGSYIATGVADMAKRPDGSMDFTLLFSVPMWASVVCLVLMIAFYPKRGRRVRGEVPA